MTVLGRFRPALLGLVCVGVVAAATALPAGAVPPERPRCPSATGTLSVKDLAGIDLASCRVRGRLVREGAATVEVPAPGRFVQAAVQTKTGPVTLSVDVDADGTVRAKVDRAGAGATPSAAGVSTRAVTPVDCTDTFQPPDKGTLRSSSQSMWLDRGSVPSTLTVSGVERVLGLAIANLNTVTNGCSVADNAALGLAYSGRTNTLHSDGWCRGSADAQNTVGFEAPPDSALQSTCTRGTTSNGVRTIIEFDIGISNDDTWWMWDTSCPTNGYHFETAMTHELGHAVGMGHADGHPSLIMYPTAASCEVRDRFGKGEANFLNAKY